MKVAHVTFLVRGTVLSQLVKDP